MLHRLDVVGPVAVEPDLARRSTANLHPGPPPQPGRSALDLLDLHLAVHSGQPAQLLDHQRRLQTALGRQGDVLEVASPAPARAGMGTGRRHTIRRRLDHLDGVGPEERGGGPGDLGHHPFAGQRVADEHHPPVVGPGHAAAAGRDGTGGQLQAGAHRPGASPRRRVLARIRVVPRPTGHSTPAGARGPTVASRATGGGYGAGADRPDHRRPVAAATEGDVVDINEALYTTRAMRRVRPDPVPLEVQAKILDAAIRAPTGGNAQNWRFLLVDDRDVIGRIGPLYRHSIDQLWVTVYADRLAAAAADPEAEESIEMLKVQRSAQWLADHFEEVPLFLFGFVQADPTGGSIFPAVWSAQLAARAEGVGQLAHRGPRLLPPRRGLRDPGCAPGRAVGDGVLRELRLSHREMGRGTSPPGPRGVLPEPVGHAGRVHRGPAAVATGIVGVVPLGPVDRSQSLCLPGLGR